MLLLGGAPAEAANRYWDAEGTNDWWSTTENWDNNTLPASGDTIYVTNGTSLYLDSAQSIGSLLFRTTRDFAFSGANTLTLGGYIYGSPFAAANGTRVTIQSPLVRPGNLAFSGWSNQSARVSGGITLTGVASTNYLSLTGSGGALADNKIDTNPINLGPAYLVVYGVWQLNVAGNTWGTTILDGSQLSTGAKLRLGAANALPATTAVIFQRGYGTLDLNGYDQTITSLVNGTAGTGTVTSATAATLTINNRTNVNCSVKLSGAGLSLTKGYGGALRLSGTNDYDGVTTVNGFFVDVYNNNSLGSTVGGTVINGPYGVVRLLAPNLTLDEAFTLNDGGTIQNWATNTTLAGAITLSGGAGSGTNSLNNAGGAVTVAGGITATGSADLRLNAAANTTGTVTTTAMNIGNGRLFKTGPGAWDIRVANQSTGATVIEEGVLLVNNTTGSATGTGPVRVNNATLGGAGTIAGVVTVYGTLSPGNSIGTLTVGGLDLRTPATVTMELAATGHDQLRVTGKATLAGALTVTLANGFVPADGQKFVVVQAGSITGAFGNAPTSGSSLPVTGGGSVRVTYTATDVTLTYSKTATP